MELPQAQVAAYVARLRRRAVALLVVRGVCGATGAATAALAIAGAAVGPVATPLAAGLALALLCLFSLAVGAAALRPGFALRGVGACRLLASADPALASSARSALELSLRPSGGVSEALIRAHAAAVQEALHALPRNRVVPLSWLRHRSVAAGLAAAAVGLLVLLVSPRARDGALALVHPARLRDDGLRTAAVIARARARMVYPSYLARTPDEAPLPDHLRLPRGTTVELTVTPRMASTAGRVRVAGADVRLDATAGGALFGRFVVRQDGPLEVRLEGRDGWFVDDTPRTVRAVPDRAPQIVIEEPGERAVARLQQPVTLRFRASDDGGITAIELAVRMPDGQERRRRLWSSVGKGPQAKVALSETFIAAELGAVDGDVLLLWLEAVDADVVSGPNIGHSATVTLEIASAAQELSLNVPRLQAALDDGIHLLGDRLELPVPEAPAAARQRFDELSDKTTAWLSALNVLIDEASSAEHSGGIDTDQLQGIVDRTGKLLRGEEALYRRGGAARTRWTAANSHMVTEHERDVLLLSDLLAQALVDEAQALTSELSSLRDEIRGLLEQMQDARNEDTKRALLSRIARALRRLQDLGASLSRLSTRVPSEFINREALPRQDAADSLEALRRAVEADDLEGAMTQLDALAEQIDALAKQIDSGGARFREAHFGGHDAALAQARQQLSMLANEQQRLAARTGDVLRSASQRARADGQDPRTEALQEHAGELARQLGELDRTSMGMSESRLLDRARDRIRDARDALRTGDVAEADRMASAAQRSAEQAAQSLEADAQMFPGHGGTTWRNAEQAAQAARALGELQRGIADAAPSSRDYLSEGERARMRGDVPPQRAARETARALGEELASGDSADAPPVSPRGANGMREVERAMERAERALERGDAQEASMAQEDASERLEQLAEDLAQRSRGEKSGRDGGGSGERPGGQRVTGRVRIPGADEFSGPVEMRRRLLDAMREEAPPGYQAPVDRYYRELLQ